MGFSFCFGPSGSGKSRVMRKMIIDRAAGSLSTPGKDKTHYIVIVPEQYTMQTQKDLVEEHPSHVLMNIDVLSFGRLAYRVFQETGEEGRTVLDDIGKSLLLRRVVSECGEELTVLQKGLHSAGMIDEIKSILSETGWLPSPESMGSSLCRQGFWIWESCSPVLKRHRRTVM